MKSLNVSRLFIIMILVMIALAADVPAQRWELLAVGDIMLGRGVLKAIEKNGNNYLFAKVKLITDSCQLLAGNLESVTSSREFTSQSPYRFKADPVITSELLKQNWSGFLSVANNHAFDCGSKGLIESCRVLDSLQIPFSGIYQKQRSSGPADSASNAGISLPAFMETAGIRVGFLAFCEPYLINVSNGDTAIAPADSQVIYNSIKALQDSCQLIIASFHWGYEYRQEPSRMQKKLGRLAVRSGAKIVLGHHPHILQGVEYYRDGIIAYSLGNFIFDQKDSLANQSAILHIIMKGSNLDSLWLEPIEIRNKRPEIKQSAGLKTLVDRLNSKFKTRSKYIEGRLYLF